MNYLSQYSIPLNGLDSNKEYKYSFVVNDAFFDFFEKSLIKGGSLDVQVKLNKKSTSLNMEIRISGNVVLPCDRCLDDYNQEIDFADNIAVALSDETNFDTNEDFVTLDRNANEINISQFIYEFSHFALPFIHYHPNDKNGNPTCNPEMLRIIEEHSVHISENNIFDVVDARWEKLIEIKKENDVNNN
ncbi:MAG: DUF177 domain-containing protein [Bacteroidales bacterium]|nr:DUF177 domain-containing protein [Bacteroidales bacterium]